MPTATTAKRAEVVPVLTRMGRVLNQDVRSEADVVRIVKLGLPADAFRHLTDKVGVEVVTLIAPESTVRRRLTGRQRFTTDESERMVRIARVYSLAMDVFGNEAAAKSWLETPASYLPGDRDVSPVELAVTDSGARMVEALLLRTAHGMF